MRERLFFNLYSSRRGHWYFLLQPRVWFAKRIVICGGGDIGQAAVRALNKWLPWLRVDVIDKSAQENPYHIEGSLVVSSVSSKSSQLLAEAGVVLVCSYAFGSEIRQQLTARASWLAGRILTLPRLTSELTSEANARLAVRPKKSPQVGNPSKRVLNGSFLSADQRWPAGFKSVPLLFVEHNIGGGTQTFGRNYLGQWDKPYLKLIYTADAFQLNLVTDESITTLSLGGVEWLERFLRECPPQQILLSSLYTFKSLPSLLKLFAELAEQKVPTTYFVHDYYCVCPSYALLDGENEFCGLPGGKECQACYQLNANASTEYERIASWQHDWKRLLSACREIVVFSQNSKNLLAQVYPELTSVIVKPHSMDYFDASPAYLQRKEVGADQLRIGIPGPLGKHKGRDQVLDLARSLESICPDWRILLFGHLPEGVADGLNSIELLGTYTAATFGNMAREAGIDVFFFPSRCPETFSYTVSEIILLGYPLLCYNLGAQAEKVTEYAKGLVIERNASPAQIIDALRALTSKSEIPEIKAGNQ